MKDVIERVAAKLCNLDFEPASPRWAALDKSTSAVRAAYADIATDLLRPMTDRITALEAKLAAADGLVQSAVRLVDVAVRISEVDNDNRMLAEVAGTQADIAAYRATKKLTPAQVRALALARQKETK